MVLFLANVADQEDHDAEEQDGPAPVDVRELAAAEREFLLGEILFRILKLPAGKKRRRRG